MEVNLPDKEQYDRIVITLNKLLIMVKELESRQLPEWVTLEEACAWKGVMAKTISEKPNRHLMPPLSERQKVGGRLRWQREVILEWSKKNDEELKILSQGLKVV